MSALDRLDRLVREHDGHLELCVSRRPRKLPDTELHYRNVTMLRAVFADETLIEPATLRDLQIAAVRMERFVAQEKRRPA
jgi:hypothetical protein